MTEWKTYKLGDILNFRRGYDLPKNSMESGDIPVAGSNGIIGYHNKCTPIFPCITIGRSGNVGTPHIYSTCWAHNTVLYVDDFKGNYPLYLYYLLQTIPLAAYGAGSAVPTLNRNHIHPIEVLHCTSIEEQKRIAGILSALDDKIELNRRINANLETQAQLLFDKMVVDGCAGAQKLSLLDIANYTNGLAMQKFRPEANEEGMPVLKIKELGQGKCDSSSDVCCAAIGEEFIVNDGDIIFSWSGTLLVDIWCGGKCGLNQHLFKVTSDSYPKWFVYFWTKHHLANFIRIAKDKAVTMGHIKRCDLAASEVYIPNEENLARIDARIAPIIDQIINNRIENKHLSTLRDTLLPKLIMEDYEDS